MAEARFQNTSIGQNPEQPNLGTKGDEQRSSTIDEQRLINALEANVVEADTIQGSEISEQRQRNHIMYTGDRMGNEKANRSQHMSLDVLDAVGSDIDLVIAGTVPNGNEQGGSVCAE